jgi:hypothetical protein
VTWLRLGVALVLVAIAAVIQAWMSRVAPTTAHWLAYGGVVLLLVLLGFYVSGRGRR